ncbi:LysE family translocator [Teredinibacter turnerae]|uniref:LysE family translocator n=1 Tax=Teredinibacter turnerae TaxID=2426 RepID=UPI00036A04C4|nr:LysE family translocator [Teredinibacter turnerae]
MQIESWLLFCGIALIATLTPGPAVLMVAVTSLSVGFKKALALTIGNVTGLFIMSSISVLGLSAVILSSSIIFTIIKYVGAIYLIYIGVRLWKSGVGSLEFEGQKKVDEGAISLYAKGILLATTNPKAIVFTTALFPQFIVINESLLPQFVLLVVSFMYLSFLCLSGYALFFCRAKRSLNNFLSQKVLGKVFGSAFFGAGCLLANSTR